MNEPMHSEAALDRIAALVERRRRGDLSQAEQRTLESLVERDPAIGALVQSLQAEDQAMEAAIDGMVAGFDFDRVKTAVDRKLVQDRRQLRMAACIAVVGPPLVAVGAWADVLEWHMVPLMASVWAAPLVLFGVKLHRRRAIARTLGAGPIVEAQRAAEKHRTMAGNERVMVQAAAILVVLGLAVWVVDSMVDGKWWLALYAAAMSGVVGVMFWRALGSRHSRRLFEQEQDLGSGAHDAVRSQEDHA
jgi:hypothetical protein